MHGLIDGLIHVLKKTPLQFSLTPCSQFSTLRLRLKLSVSRLIL